MIKLVALLIAYRLLRRVVMIAIVVMLSLMLLSATRETAGRGSHAVRQLQNPGRPLEQLLQHRLRKAIGP